MTSYLLTFTVYTTAMVGAIFLAVFVYKKFSVTNSKVSASKFLEVEDCISLGVRKQLYIVRAGEEKFLLASDAERTTFLSKLGVKDAPVIEKREPLPQFNNPRNIEFDVANLYSENDYKKKDTTTILRNIVSTGDRNNG